MVHKMRKKKKCHIVRTIPKSDRKIVESETKCIYMWYFDVRFNN